LTNSISKSEISFDFLLLLKSFSLFQLTSHVHSRHFFVSGTLELHRVRKVELEDSDDFMLPDGDDPDSVVVPSTVTAWSVMNYLRSERAQGYFRGTIGRFSKDIFKKEMDLSLSDDGTLVADVNERSQKLLSFKKMVVSRRFASDLTRAVDEIVSDGVEDEFLPPMLREDARQGTPALEFIKNISVILELDSDVEAEVHSLKRSLLSQVGVAEYARAAQWVNPCPRFILPDVFCVECSETRDVNLCYVPPRGDVEDDYDKMWLCGDCGTPYDVGAIQRRLIGILHRKLARYQLQDLRCASSTGGISGRVARRALSPQAESASGLKLDTPPIDARRDVKLLHSLADFHDLGTLKETAAGVLRSFR